MSTLGFVLLVGLGLIVFDFWRLLRRRAELDAQRRQEDHIREFLVAAQRR